MLTSSGRTLTWQTWPENPARSISLSVTSPMQAVGVGMAFPVVRELSEDVMLWDYVIRSTMSRRWNGVHRFMNVEKIRACSIYLGTYQLEIKAARMLR